MMGVLELGKTDSVYQATERCWIEGVVILFVRARCFGQTGWATVHMSYPEGKRIGTVIDTNFVSAYLKSTRLSRLCFSF
jgi:hypothetical protein